LIALRYVEVPTHADELRSMKKRLATGLKVEPGSFQYSPVERESFVPAKKA